MKLLFCSRCQDVRKLSGSLEEPTRCKCGESSAQYKPDCDTAWISGRSAKLIGLVNPFFWLGNDDAVMVAKNHGYENIIFWYPEDNGKIERRR